MKRGCRPIVSVDGCHLTRPHKGVWLSACGIDPNNGMFPICYCVTEDEHKRSWTWFVELLIEDIGIYEQEKWTIISDRQKGLLPAIYELLPRIEHRYRVKHIYDNFKKEHHGLSLKDKLWGAARATHVNQFKAEMDALKKLDEHAYKWLAEINLTHWTKSYFRTSPKCDLLLNNLSETFNSVILDARIKPLIGMVETIRIYLQKRLQAKREYIEKYDCSICPNIQGKLEKLKDQSRICISSHAGGGKFEVRDMFGGRYAININEKTCSCRGWDLT
ncbi:PREDICTED: uncharacterized protein LOC105949246 [Erythranthe guttata]|uniref:uncharacterized protein LOC105949246 n=1 Tax=Erythranthe guttata TaxID=4155 RepID=UPI00064D8908|nr:PREDICTED: uncharacterized protein LOC105949246 [Erythranthe guttata]|eukprot:XP_012827986.1 PREDICTED: uncharacterized protein LOC105949246 [Erythranthe guttata]